MDKLVREWETHANRLDRRGEMLAAPFRNGQLVAIGGLNIDPYAGDITTARLRHVYVLGEARRKGIASAIVRYLLDVARASFASVRLFTDTAEAAALYEGLGFAPANSAGASHMISLP